MTRLKLEHQAALDAGAAHARAHHSAPPLSPQVTRLKLEHQAALNAGASALEDALAAALHARPMDDAQLTVLAAAMQQLGGGDDALRHSASGAELPNLASRESEQAGRQRTGRAHSATAELRKRRPWTELLTIRAPTTSANQPVISAVAPTVSTPSDAMPCATSSSAASAIGLRRSSSRSRSRSRSRSNSRTPEAEEAEEEETKVTAQEGAAVGLANDLAVARSRSRSRSSSSISSSRDAGAGGDRSSSSDDDGGHQEGAHLGDLAPTPRGTSSLDTAQAPVPRRSTRSIGIQATSEIATSEYIRGGAVGPLDARVITLAAGKVDIVFHPSAARALRGVSTWGTRVNPCQPCSRGAQAPLRTAVVEQQGQRLQLSAPGIHTLSAPGCVLRIHVQ